LGGYSEEKREDMHTITDLKSFDYLTTLPKDIFGKTIALEVYNPIKEQLEFRQYVGKILNGYLAN
jgi:hypothetical protein